MAHGVTVSRMRASATPASAQHRGEPAQIADDFRLRSSSRGSQARGAPSAVPAPSAMRAGQVVTPSGRLQDVRIVDVDRRALDEQAAEHAGAGDDGVDRGEAAGRRSADAALLRVPGDAIARLDERDHLVDQERRIARALWVRLRRAAGNRSTQGKYSRNRSRRPAWSMPTTTIGGMRPVACQLRGTVSSTRHSTPAWRA